MRKKFRFLTVLAVCVMVLSCFSVTAFAYADDTEQNLPVTEATQPEQQPAVTPTPEKPKGEPIDDEGNAYTRDLLYDKATNKQFITVQTKNGNTSLQRLKSRRNAALPKSAKERLSCEQKSEMEAGVGVLHRRQRTPEV